MKGKFWVLILALLLAFILGGFLGRGILLFGSVVLRGSNPGSGLGEIHLSRPQGNIPTTGRIDLNTATEETLQELPGIGPVLAKSILNLRQTLGKFTAVSQLLQVEGLGEGTYDRIKDLVYIGEN